MRVYISVDIEGIAGVATGEQVVSSGRGYSRAQHLMTGEANAAVAGAFDAGADVVLLSDSHGSMDNLVHELLDERAHIVFGSPRVGGMMHGLVPGFDLALFVGYHAAAGERGVLAHTFSSLFSAYRLNGQTVSEAEVNALYASACGVPVGLVTGDDSICAVAATRLPGVFTVPVKEVEGWNAVNSLHPAAARVAIRQSAARAVAAAHGIRPTPIPDRLVLEVQMQIPSAAELAAMVPGTEQIDACTVRREVANPSELLRLTSVWYELATSVSAKRWSLLLR